MINLKNILNRIIIISIFLVPIKANAVDIIRDSEIENAIFEVVAPLVKASGISNLKLHILSDDSINAFTSGGNEIFINSGLITTFPDPEVLRGVIAHEMGHVMGHHVIRKIEDFEKGNNLAASSIAIGLLSALSGSPVLGIGVMAGGVNYAGSQSLKSSRVYESSADQSALALLEKSGNTSVGLLKLLEFLNNSDPSDLCPYDQTHPLSPERISAVNIFLKNSKYKTSTTSEKVRYDFVRASYKLAAFTTPLSEPVRKSGSDEIDTYVKTIRVFKQGKLQESISMINSLLSSKPEDPYYNELKGQMLFEFGKKESYDSYLKASKLLPNDVMIKLSKAAVMINVFNNPHYYQEIIQDLKFVLSKEQDNIVALYFLSVAYEKSGDEGRSNLYNAIMLYKQGKIKEAKMMAKAAIKNLPSNTPDWYKASDIISFEDKN